MSEYEQLAERLTKLEDDFAGSIGLLTDKLNEMDALIDGLAEAMGRRDHMMRNLLASMKMLALDAENHVKDPTFGKHDRLEAAWKRAQ